MSPEKDRRQSFRLIVTESLMVIAVIITVIILTLLTAGYWLGGDLRVERQGMLQVSSVPTGATVTVDGSDWGWLDRTNASKVISAGEHTVSLSKDGYDTWSRTVNVTEGLLYRLHYPRLFLQNRESLPVYDVSSYTFATISPDNNYMLLTNNTTEWLLLNLENDKLEPTKLNIAPYFTSVSLATDAKTGLFTGEILSADWSENHERLLLKVGTGSSIEWVLLNPKNLTTSINLTREFATDFTRIEILDSSASQLLAIKNGNLHKIDVGGRQISAILVENITDFDHFNSEVVFVAKTPLDAISSVPSEEDTTSSVFEYYIGLLNLGNNKISTLKYVKTPPRLVISKFYDDKYLTTLSDNLLTVYEYNHPNTEFLTAELEFTPETIKVGHDGEFIEMTAGAKIATLDMEAQQIREWQIDSTRYGWFDHDMLYAIANGELIVYDYDGLNRRVLATNASAHFPAVVTSDKWLYYVSDGSLIREIIN